MFSLQLSRGAMFLKGVRVKSYPWTRNIILALPSPFSPFLFSRNRGIHLTQLEMTPFLNLFSVPEASSLPLQCDQQEGCRPQAQRQSCPSTDSGGDNPPTASFSSFIKFCWTGKEMNSKGRKWPRDRNNMWKAKLLLPPLCFKAF